MKGITLDTGALLALERRRDRMVRVLHAARRASVPITVPSPVVTEWWRGRSDAREHVLAFLRVDRVDEGLARTAGEALAAITGATAIDAIVMASAARRGDVVYTSDLGDLERLQRFFPSVRLLSS
ncbi:MAG: twitching motility protein PilT [Polyangiaceae bacterium]